MFEQGVKLESGKFLHWGATAEELLEIENPKHNIRYERHQANGAEFELRRYEIWWPKQNLIDGLYSSIKVITYGDQPVYEYEIDCSSIERGDARKTFVTVSNHLNAMSELKCVIENNPISQCPTGKWKYGEAEITMYIFDRFVEMCILKISSNRKYIET